jgi:hypothetical protein
MISMMLLLNSTSRGLFSATRPKEEAIRFRTRGRASDTVDRFPCGLIRELALWLWCWSECLAWPKSGLPSGGFGGRSSRILRSKRKKPKPRAGLKKFWSGRAATGRIQGHQNGCLSFMDSVHVTSI